MSIAVLGWGSLIWCPGNLRITTKWRPDGPVLPIEFARISQDNRLTLVVHLGSADQATYWALSEFTALEQARENLREREGSRLADIHYVLRDGVAADGAPPVVVMRIREWLTPRQDLQAAIWTGLPSNWPKKRGGRNFTPQDAVTFLSELEAERDRANATYERAREYLVNAPPLIDTDVRRIMRERGWKDAHLPEILFEEPRQRASGDPR